MREDGGGMEEEKEEDEGKEGDRVGGKEDGECINYRRRRRRKCRGMIVVQLMFL